MLNSSKASYIAILMCLRCQLAIYTIHLSYIIYNTFRVLALICHNAIYLRITNDIW